jgi:hypothetical protein
MHAVHKIELLGIDRGIMSIGNVAPQETPESVEIESRDDDGEHLFIDCPNCGAIGFHYAGVYQSDDGQYDNVWYCPFCDYTETT